jgi:hypothetical protein
MNAWEAARQALRDSVLQEFTALGYSVRSSALIEGEVEVGRVAPILVEITLPDDFPYQPPKVRPPDGSGGLSWHSNPDGSLCLWAEEETGDLPWRSAKDIEQRIQEWFRKDNEGWVDDTPDIDLERYWHRTPGLVIYEGLESMVGHVARVEFQKNNVLRLKAGAPPKQGKQRAAFVLDVGELERPVRSFHDILDRAGDLKDRIEREATQGRLQLIVVRYWRAGTPAVLALRISGHNPVELQACESADAGSATLTMRSGLDRDALTKSAVAVVGAGAVGSQVAELLARSGVGRLTLVDYDVIRPGNCIRHIARLDDVGEPKVQVVADAIASRRLMAHASLKVVPERIATVEQASKLLTEHDLVIDASGNATATRLLLEGAEALQRRLVSVCLVHDGRVARIDRMPLRDDEEHLPRVPDSGGSTELREGGCGDPVSPAPMWAATMAAARAVAVAVDMIVDRQDYPPTVVDVLVAELPPYDRIGTVI